MYIKIDDMLVESDSYFRVNGEVSGKLLEEYQGRYAKEVGFYKKFIESIDTETETSLLKKLKDGSSEQLKLFRDLLKEGRNLWEYTKLVGVYEYGDKVVLFTEHKVGDFYPFRLDVIRKNGGDLFFDLSGELDLIQSALVYVGFHARENKHSLSVPSPFEVNLSALRSYFGWESIGLSQGAAYYFKVTNLTGQVEKARDVLAYLEGDNRNSFSQIEGLVSQDSKERYSDWMEQMSLDVNDQEFLTMEFPKNISHRFSLPANQNCFISFFAPRGQTKIIKKYFICNYEGEYKIHNLLYSSEFNSRFESAEFLEQTRRALEIKE